MDSSWQCLGVRGPVVPERRNKAGDAFDRAWSSQLDLNEKPGLMQYSGARTLATFDLFILRRVHYVEVWLRLTPSSSPFPPFPSFLSLPLTVEYAFEYACLNSREDEPTRMLLS